DCFEHSADSIVLHSAQPSDASVGVGGKPGADGLDDEDVGKPGGHGLSTRLRVREFAGYQTQGVTDRPRGSGSIITDDQQLRHRTHELPCRRVIERNYAADQLTGATGTSVPQEGIAIGEVLLRQQINTGTGRCVWRTGQMMSEPMR